MINKQHHSVLFVLMLLAWLAGFMFGCSPPSYPGFGVRYENGGTFNGSSPVLCPDSESLVCAFPSKHKVGNIYQLFVDGSSTRIVLDSSSYLGFPDVSPDGEKVVYVDESSGVPAIWVADITGQRARKLTKSQHPEENPVFSSDGARIAFTRRLRMDDPNRWSSELFIIDVDDVNGQSEVRLTNDRCVDIPVRFSRDNSHLYFVSERSWHDLSSTDLRAQLFRLSIGTRAVEPVLRLDLRAAAVCDMSMDETTVVYADDPKGDFAYDVFTCKLDGSEKQQRTMLRSYIGSVRFGFHDDRFAFIEQKHGHGPARVYIYDMNSSSMNPVKLP